jgi:cation diffusion facilitator CzcD-associated flavoprotein CzcO
MEQDALVDTIIIGAGWSGIGVAASLKSSNVLNLQICSCNKFDIGE